MISKIKLTAIIILVLAGAISATTFHVSKNGNDSNSGLGWNNAWETLDKVNAGTFQGGDTLYFGTGIWRGHLKLQPGTFGNHVVYACSAFADTNANGDWHFAKIWGSVNYADSGWTQVGATNVYYTGYEVANGGLCCQGDSILWLQADSAGVNSAGEFWISDDSSNVYVYVHNLDSKGYNPSSYDNIELAHNPVVCIGNNCDASYRSDSANHVILYGLEFKYGVRHVIGMYGDPKPDSLFIQHCKITHSTEYGNSDAENPACIYAGNSNSIAEYLHVQACSIGYSHRYNGAGNHGCGISIYAVSNMTIDSCAFYGFFSGIALMFKHAYDYYPQAQGHVVKYNIFNQTYGNGLMFYSHTNHDSVYGNIFKGTGSFIVGCSWDESGGGGTAGVPGSDIFFFNNTIYNCGGYNRYENTPAEQCDANKSSMENVQFKYNILYATQATIGTQTHRNVHAMVREWYDSTGFFIFDSNLYCVDEQVYMCGDYAEGHWELDSLDWADLGYDLNSNWVSNLSDIGFSNPAYGDFSRPNASTEMYRTYGGKTWSLYGAWQPDDPLPPPIDSIPPGLIEDLNAIPGDDNGEIILAWTAPGDDGFTGLADHYVIKYSPTVITESNWADFPAVLNPPQPLYPGDSTYFAFDTHEDGHYYYIAIKTYDEVGIVSDLSNVAFTFSAGIMVPTQISTEIDSANNSVTVSCELVESYKSIDYLFALDSISVFSNPEFIIDSLANDVATAVFEGLSGNVNYYWRCCAISTDYTDSSAWSPSIEFNLHFGLISSLAESDCLRPTEGEIVPSRRPYFIVRNPLNVYELYFQVDDDDNFSSPVESGSVPIAPGDETRWQLPAIDPLEQGIIYYWRVSNNNAVWTSPINFSALLEIHPYPNPFRASEGHTNITFTNLPQDSSIMISTISGEIILREDKIGPDDWMWDVKNDRGNNLAPGVYLYAINFPSGSSNGKLLIIR